MPSGCISSRNTNSHSHTNPADYRHWYLSTCREATFLANALLMLELLMYNILWPWAALTCSSQPYLLCILRNTSVVGNLLAVTCSFLFGPQLSHSFLTSNSASARPLFWTYCILPQYRMLNHAERIRRTLAYVEMRRPG